MRRGLLAFTALGFSLAFTGGWVAGQTQTDPNLQGRAFVRSDGGLYVFKDGLRYAILPTVLSDDQINSMADGGVITRLDQLFSGSAALPTPASAGGIGAIGRPLEAAGLRLTVLTAQRTPQGNGRPPTPPAGSIYMVTDILLENTGRDSESHNPLDFRARDDSGVTYNPALGAMDPQFATGVLARGDRVRGMVAFVVPATSRNLVLYYEPSGADFFGKPPMRIALE
jgi:hypothetical protein